MTPPAQARRRVGLTGGIACGKSTVQEFLQARGVPVLDTDKVAHEVMRQGSDVHTSILQTFGDSILNEKGEIHRAKLGRLVFSDPQALSTLNRLVHPEVGRRWRQWLRDQTAPLAVVAIPLLFECGLQSEFDGVLCVHAPESLMKQRLLLRGLDEAQAQQRIQSQWPVDQKAEASTWTLKNHGTLPKLKAQVDAWFASMMPHGEP